MRVLDLCSGIGGFSLGLERSGMNTIAFCEIDGYCKKVLNKHWPNVPIADNIENLHYYPATQELVDDGEVIYAGAIELICGGYPCQPFSTAGKRRGDQDDRHLWPEMFRLLQEIRPTWLIGENVAGHISMGLDEVLSDLENEGYSVQPFVIPAVAVDAQHRRDRVWIIAHSNCFGLRDEQKSGVKCEDTTESFQYGKTQSLANSSSGRLRREAKRKIQLSRRAKAIGTGEAMAYTQSKRLRKKRKPFCGLKKRIASASAAPSHVANTNIARLQNRRQARFSKSTSQNKQQMAFTKLERCSNARWPVEPAVGRVVNGFPGRVDRIKALGNAVVPQIPQIIGQAIMEVSA